jgi:hypothetical protein
MFFDTLESRQMLSATIQSASLKLPHITLPATLVSAKPVTASLKQTKVVATTAAKNKALVSAVIKSEIALLSDVLAGKLKNLKTDLSDLKSKAAKAGGQLQSLLGSTVAVNVGVPTSELGALRGMGGATDHLGNLLGNQKINGGRNGQLSDDVPGGLGIDPTQAEVDAAKKGNTTTATDTTKSKGLFQSIVDFFTSDSTKSAVKTGANDALDVGMEKFGPPGGGEALTILRGPDTVQSVTGDARDLLNGFIAIFQSGDKNPRMPDKNGNTKGGGDPVPSDMSNDTSGFITAAELKDALAKLRAHSEPTADDSGGGSGGKLNTGASGTGKINSQAQYTEPATTTVSISARDLVAVAIRLTSKITVTH